MYFKNVSIWTACSVEWFDYVNQKIFSKYLKNEKFHHVWTFDNCKIVYDSVPDNIFLYEFIKKCSFLSGTEKYVYLYDF
uniref:Uncharacterized protein n=1 Tax=viral metagenome TaxID=1070528 RepID=A0A6C0AEK9_9ZZZZ